jgi:hypothetical protein
MGRQRTQYQFLIPDACAWFEIKFNFYDSNHIQLIYEIGRNTIYTIISSVLGRIAILEPLLICFGSLPKC